MQKSLLIQLLIFRNFKFFKELLVRGIKIRKKFNALMETPQYLLLTSTIDNPTNSINIFVLI